ncbi:MAG: M67 family metallopeptidase [Acidobacteriota bacterium]|jgi:proteasome lid subunit RPN8/RPN11
MSAEPSAPAAIDTLYLPTAIADNLRREAARCYPAEACGFLIGACSDVSAVEKPPARVVSPAPSQRRAVVEELRVERNRAGREDRYLIDAADVFAAMRAARRAGNEILAVYHSHPDGHARPSHTDLRDAWGEWLYVIVACSADGAEEITCWRRADGELVQIEWETG